MNSNSENMLFALLTGAEIGAGLGVLYAPDKGKNTRGKIKHRSEDMMHDISERVTHAKDELTKTAKEKKKDFEKKLENTISDMTYKADDIIAGLESKLEELKSKKAQAAK